MTIDMDFVIFVSVIATVIAIVAWDTIKDKENDS